MVKKAIKKTVRKPAVKAKAKKTALFPGFFKDKLGNTDPKIAQAIAHELQLCGPAGGPSSGFADGRRASPDRRRRARIA